MDLIKLLDVSSPKNIKNVINTLITEYAHVAENFPTKLSDLTDDETHRLVTDAEKTSWNNKLSAIPNSYKTKDENDNLYQPKGDYLTSFTEVDPTVPAWAKAATKPSYNYSEINNTPTIPIVNNSTITIKQGEETKGTFTLNQSSNSTIELDVGGGGGSSVTLYGSTGQNTDGAMTQKATTDELNKKPNFVETEEVTITVNRLLDLVYPIGSLRLSDNGNEQSFMGGTWVITGQGRTIIGAGVLGDNNYSVGDLIPAGLPNITGSLSRDDSYPLTTTIQDKDGALDFENKTTNYYVTTGSGSGSRTTKFLIDASKSNSIYGKSNTVHMNGFVTYIYKRIG